MAPSVKEQLENWADTSPAVVQSSTFLLFGAAIIVILTVPGMGAGHPNWFAAGIATELLATAISLALSVRRSLWHLVRIVAALNFVALAFLRLGTDSDNSLLIYLAMLPVLVFAFDNQRRNIAFAAVGTFLALIVPVVVDTVAESHSFADSIVNLSVGVMATLVCALVALIFNKVMRDQRTASSRMSDLATLRDGLLHESAKQIVLLEESQAKRRAVEETFRGLWGAVTEQAAIGTDLTGLIDAWNPGAEKMLGLTREQMENRRHITSLHVVDELTQRERELNLAPDERGAGQGFSALIDSASRGAADVGDWTYVRGDGVQIPVQLSVTARLSEQGEIVGYLFVANDMTEVHEVAKLKDDFVGLISHELRTPLSSILGYLELMRDEDESILSSNQLHYLGIAERNAHRLLRLVGDLLFTAQVESGSFHLEMKALELGPILSASVESARPLAASSGVTVIADVAADVVVEGDSVRLGQAVDNLVSNAIKFTPHGGTVTVSLAVGIGGATVTVRDTGMGIAASEMDMLFSRFFRATTATRNAVPGVGLGLTITRAIISAHHGVMSATSDEGVGTSFSFTLQPARRAALIPL